MRGLIGKEQKYRFLSRKKIKFELHSVNKFKRWMNSKSVFPFDREQLQLTDGMVEYAYAVYRFHVGAQNRERSTISFQTYLNLHVNGQILEMIIDERGLGVLKTLLDGNIKLLLKLEDFWTPTILNDYDSDGKLKILQFREVDEREMNSLFLLYGVVYFVIQYFKVGAYIKEKSLIRELSGINNESPYSIRLKDGIYSPKIGYTKKF